MRPHCPTCGSANVALVTSGLSCLDCELPATKLYPKEVYEDGCLERVVWRGTPKMGCRNGRSIGIALARMLNGEPATKINPFESRGGPKVCAGQMSMWDMEEETRETATSQSPHLFREAE